MSSPQLPAKPDVCLALLQSSHSIYLHLDPRKEGAHVPPWFKDQPQLVLQVGLNMAVPIPDLDVGPEALSCTLSFNRRAEFCHISWDCIYGIVGEDGRGMIWPDSVPVEVAAAAEGRPQTPQSQRPSLRLAAEDGESLPPEPDEKPSLTTHQTLKEQIGLASTLSDEMTEEELQLPERVETEALREPKAPLQEPQAQEDGSPIDEPRATKSGRSIPPYLRVVK